uniref:SRA1/Sec31 domain-containing protein n=1 Tax=Oryzias latipes TaxID=8090 RepID=A0A3P9KVI4_ORYLA
MEDTYVKPGNQERGWNDPPQFSYALQMARGPPKNHLNKRVAAPVDSGAGVLPTTPPSADPLGPPPCGIAQPPSSIAPPPRGIAPPPLSSVGFPPAGVATPLPQHEPMNPQKETGVSQSEPNLELVMSVLNRALQACRVSVTDYVCNEVEKRLRLLEDSWRSGKLSFPVKRRMEVLARELQMGNWSSADEVHRSLMVDHVTEVSQWMVGVKRLIAEVQNLSPELLETLKNPTGPDQDSGEPAPDPSPLS